MSVSLYLLVIVSHLCTTLIINVNANTFHWNSNFNHDTPQWQRASQQNSAVCVEIPTNLTLCHGIGYTKMRLPNLLNHDTLREVSQQSTSWMGLSQLNCHPDTQLFLCSLFSPVCLDHPIPPCRSLCLSVQTSCEHVMLKYGYPWPKIVQCDQFPIDNDMCIQAQHTAPGHSTSSQSLADKKLIITNQHTENKHKKNGNKKGHGNKKQRRYHPIDSAEYPPARKETVYEPQPGHLQRHSQLDSETRMKEEPQVDQVITTNEGMTERPQRRWNKDQRQLYNDIISNFCQSEWILKARLFPINGNKMEIKVRNYRLIHGSIAEQQQQKQTPLVLSVNSTIIDTIRGPTAPEHPVPSTGDDVQQSQSRRRYFIIGKTGPDGENRVTYVMQWPHKSAQLRKAIKAITNGDYDCNRSDNSDANTAGDRHKARDKPESSTSAQSRQQSRDKNGRRNGRKDKNKNVEPNE